MVIYDFSTDRENLNSWSRRQRQDLEGDFNKQQTPQRNCIKISAGDFYVCKCGVLNAF